MIELLIKIIFLDYQSLTVVILISTFELLLVVVAKNLLMDSIVFVLLVLHILLLHMLVVTIIVNQLLGMLIILTHTFSMTHYGMEQDA